MWKRTTKKQLSKKQGLFGLLKKTLVTTALGLGLTANVAFADDAYLSTIYHVYVDGEHIGTIDNKDTVESHINKIIDNQEDTYNDYSLAVGEEISFVTEKVFDPMTSNQKVIDYIDDEISVIVNAYELKIGDKVLGYFKDQETAETVLNNYKSKYVDKEMLEKVEAAKDSEEVAEQTNLTIGESKVIDIYLSDEVKISEEKVLPKQILSVEEGETLLEKGTLEDKKHKVAEGEVLGGIAAAYDLSTKEILELNPTLTEESVLQIGQEINVTSYEPFVNVIVNMEELVEEKIAYETETINSDDLYKGDTKVKQEGKEGKKNVHYSIEKINGATTSKEVLDEKVTTEPVKEIIIKGTKVVPSRGSGQFTWPAVGGFITSHVGQRWGSYHKGIDIAGVGNRSILAADNGVVVSAGWDNGGYGNKVIINHRNGYKTLYAHLSSINVNVGQTVTQGSKIGVMGTTGNSTGIHLHFEVYKNGSLVNPAGLF